jgi:Ser/Thr protein kinase RdoA (MazF antagonist)
LNPFKLHYRTGYENVRSLTAKTAHALGVLRLAGVMVFSLDADDASGMAARSVPTRW